jgi:arsenate reductase (thioredoxin)
MHVGFPDPAWATGTEEEIMAAFRQVRDEIRQQIIPLIKEKLGKEKFLEASNVTGPD